MPSTSGLSIEAAHEPRLCYAMQQSAVPWLHHVRVHNGGTEPATDLQVVIELDPPLAEPLVRQVAEVGPGATVTLDKLDPRLDLQGLANLLERVRGELRVTVRDSAGEAIGESAGPIEILAYNEWPGLAVLPSLLAAFVAPNHPALSSVLHEVSERLSQRTGSGALDGYQSESPARARAMVEAVHEALRLHGITYVSAPPSFEQNGQKVRTPEQVIGDRLATCLDLAVLYAAVLEHMGLHPLVILQRTHAFVGVWLVDGSAPESTIGPAVELRKRCDLRGLVVVECTACCASNNQSFEAAEKSARGKLDDDEGFVLAVDVAAARRQGIGPLPPRTTAFLAGEDVVRPAPLAPPPLPAAGGVGGGSAGGGGADTSQQDAGPTAKDEPDDRLEHWKSKLLDLTMFNRLLNFRETKKTIALCDHDTAALEDRIQQGSRLRIHPRPSIGQADDPRDLELAEQRTGRDVLADFLAEELRAGRLRADHEPEDLDDRLVQIYRHARTTLEESGANTLYLAVGFLRWFETPQSKKPRRAPLLLLPLVIERTSVQEGFRLVLDDAEPRINKTLLQMLKRDFDLEIDLDTPPEDDRGVDVDEVLDIFRAAVLVMPRWEVESAVHIGFFSFTKYLMWLDLAARDDLLQSGVLRHLVETPGASLQQEVPELARDELDDLDPAEVFCPKDADSSQMAAVLAGAAGRTFVLEGPPGTGKSQTITNLMAQAMANGKRVLFVAEKRAALEVVQRRLDSVGLGAFCLELHSSKSGAKSVLAQLQRPLELGSKREPRKWQELSRELQEQRAELNRYVRLIHNRREHGFSVFTAISKLVHLRTARRVPMPELLSGAPADVAAARRATDELAAAAIHLGVPDQEPWWGVRRTDWSPALLRDVVPAAERLSRATTKFGAAATRVVALFGMEGVLDAAGPSHDQIERILELADLFRAPSLPPSALLRQTGWRLTDEALSALTATGRQRDGLWAPMAERWDRGLLDLDLDRLAAAHRRWANSFFLFRWWFLRGPRSVLAGASTGKLDRAVRVRDDLERALQVREEERRLEAGADAASALGTAWNDGLADWDQIDAWVQWIRAARRLAMNLVPGSLQPAAPVLEGLAVQLDGLAEGADVLPGQLATLQATHDEYTAAKNAVVAMLALDPEEAFGDGAAPGYCAAVEARVHRWLGDVPRLREQCAYARAAEALAANGAEPLVLLHATGDLRTDELRTAFERTFLETWLDTVHKQEPSLAMFRGSDHERAVAQFSELDRRAISVAAKVIVARLAARLPRLRDTQVASSELGILERELKKQRRHKPVRRLLSEIPGLLSRVAPCVLMSPLSVAQFLGRSGMRFDLVVFDEASQIPMWDAVGAIGRGNSLVVVGDSRQLPPTSFFQRIDQDDEIENDAIPEDLESVLDECGAAGLPRMYLDWHYRSRHESLIAFSNHYYYNNRLLTFPAPQERMPGFGVRFVHAQGVYDRGGSQQNRIEAEKLVAEVLRRLRDPEQQEYSIGIVTFSRAQQVLIEDLLDRARGDNSDIEPFFTAVEEPVFVKNLENVQGDERDTILFSICYGPDAAGKIYENYGPINQQGGERRLNVAVTRARRELVVFSSVRADQVATRTTAIGARHLRAFLDYAERGEAALIGAVAADPSGDVESPFEAAVRDALVQRGYEIHPQVGCSGYRIDLGVVDSDAPGRYLLGIECDGATYHSAATARDRDRIRASVLRGLGWHLHRVWSMDFWQDPEGEIDRIEAAVAEARSRRQPIAPQADSEPEGDDESPEEAELDADAEQDNALPEPVSNDAPMDDAEPAEPQSEAESESQAVAPTAPVAAASAAEPELDSEADLDERETDDPEAIQAFEAPDNAGEPGEAHDPDGPRPYVVAALPTTEQAHAFYEQASWMTLRAQVEEVLAAEAPVAFDRLAKTIATAWGVSRVTNRVRTRLREALPESVFEDGGVCYRSPDEPASFVGFRVPSDDAATERAADDLPIIEVQNAMAWLLQQHHALSAEDLAREAARCFGITRLGSVVRGVMDEGLERLAAAGLAQRDGDTVRLP